MATSYQLGKYAKAEGIPAETAIRDLRRDLAPAQLKLEVAAFLDGFGVKQNPARGVLFKRCVAAAGKRKGVRDAHAVCAAAGRRKLGQAEMTRRAVAGRRAVRKHANPAAGAVEAYRDFHGHDPEQVITVKKKVHFHKNLAGAGELVALSVRGIDKQDHIIDDFGGALLAFNEKKNQLFVEGGDQAVNLDDFAIDEPHELEHLGKVLDIDYHADKKHLGSEGGDAVYHHKFRTTNLRGEHVIVTIKRYPELIYRVLDEQLEFAGGSYIIRREGIDF